MAGPSCGRSDETLLPREQFIEIYIDLLERGVVHRVRPDSAVIFPADSIVAHYGTTQDEFLATVKAYAQDAREWQEFFAEVSRRLEEKMKKEREAREAGVSPDSSPAGPS